MQQDDYITDEELSEIIQDYDPRPYYKEPESDRSLMIVFILIAVLIAYWMFG